MSGLCNLWLQQFNSLIFKLNALWLLIIMIAHQWTCVHPIFRAHLIIFLGLLNLDIITSTPPLECLHCLFVCNLQFKLISFLYIQTLHNDWSPIEDVHRRRGFIKRREAGIFPFYSGMFPLLLLINLYRVYMQILSYHPPTLPWYPNAKKVNETPATTQVQSRVWSCLYYYFTVRHHGKS